MLTVFSGRTSLRLPVRPENPADAALPAFGAPEQAEDTPVKKHEPSPLGRRTVTRDLLTGKITVDFPRWTGHTELTDIGQTVNAQGLCRHTFVEGDPLSSTIETEYRVNLKRPDTSVTHHSTGKMTCDATHFRVAVTLDIYENDKKVFSRNWIRASSGISCNPSARGGWVGKHRSVGGFPAIRASRAGPQATFATILL